MGNVKNINLGKNQKNWSYGNLEKMKDVDRNKRKSTVREDGSRHLERPIVKQPIFRNFKMSNI